MIRVTSRRDETVPPLRPGEGPHPPDPHGPARARPAGGAGRRRSRRRCAQGKSPRGGGRSAGLTVEKSAAPGARRGPPPLACPALVARAFELEARRDGAASRSRCPAGLRLHLAGRRSRRLAPARAEGGPGPGEGGPAAGEGAERGARARAADLRARAESDGPREGGRRGLALVRKETPGAGGPRASRSGDLGSERGPRARRPSPCPRRCSPSPSRRPAGYAVLRVLEKKPFDPAAFEKEKAALVASLRQQRRAAALPRVTCRRRASAYRAAPRRRSPRWRADAAARPVARVA